jgi:hypothetical protein
VTADVRFLRETTALLRQARAVAFGATALRERSLDGRRGQQAGSSSGRGFFFGGLLFALGLFVAARG